jgi:ketosteroid isomerase-like protein
MSDRIGVVRRAFDAIARRDQQALLDELDPSVEIHPLVSVWQRTYRGHEGIEQWWGHMAGLWEEFSFHAFDFRDLDEETLLVLAQWRGRAKGSATAIDGPAILLIGFRAGLIGSVDAYLDEAGALKAFEVRQSGSS